MSVVITSDPDCWGISWSGWGDIKRGLTSADFMSLKLRYKLNLEPLSAGMFFQPEVKFSVILNI